MRLEEMTPDEMAAEILRLLAELGIKRLDDRDGGPAEKAAVERAAVAAVGAFSPVLAARLDRAICAVFDVLADIDPGASIPRVALAKALFERGVLCLAQLRQDYPSLRPPVPPTTEALSDAITLIASELQPSRPT